MSDMQPLCIVVCGGPLRSVQQFLGAIIFPWQLGAQELRD